jgi:hypothetical protein
LSTAKFKVLQSQPVVPHAQSKPKHTGRGGLRVTSSAASHAHAWLRWGAQTLSARNPTYVITVPLKSQPTPYQAAKPNEQGSPDNQPTLVVQLLVPPVAMYRSTKLDRCAADAAPSTPGTPTLITNLRSLPVPVVWMLVPHVPVLPHGWCTSCGAGNWSRDITSSGSRTRKAAIDTGKLVTLAVRRCVRIVPSQGPRWAHDSKSRNLSSVTAWLKLFPQLP